MNSSAKKTELKEGLQTPVQFCPGVGPKRASLFNKMSVFTIRDLFWHLPRGYEDFEALVPIRHLKAGGVYSVTGTVRSIDSRRPRGRSRVRHILEITVEDHSGILSVIWFNQHFLQEKLKIGEDVLLHGKVDYKDSFLQMSSPKLQPVGKKQQEGSGILPLYPLTDGLNQGSLRGIVKKALERFASYCDEFLPKTILEKRGWPNRLEAFRILHAPKAGEGAPTDYQLSEEELLFDAGIDPSEVREMLFDSSEDNTPWKRAKNRLIFEEFFLHQFILRRYAGHVKQKNGIAHPLPSPDPFAVEDKTALDAADRKHWPAVLIESLPFQLTEEQIKVCREIQRDMASDYPMNRLLQGDVGCGKTVVSLYAMLVAAASGKQAALMAPTDLLARQHHANVLRLTKGLTGCRTVLLTGKSKARETNEALEAIRNGWADLAIGTHSLFQERVEFSELGLAVVDEQHKFGVNQRQMLLEKGEHPDLLVASATPIPRTLSLSMFGDMEISTIKTLPPGRPPVVTRWTHWTREKKVWEFVDGLIEEGQQAYVVCPIIDPSETMPHLPSTEEAFERISTTFLEHRRVAVLHGRHSAEDKSGLMDKMREGGIDVVIATTVVEVGVDLPNATVMVVMGAERFGLSQLHQLRGRVGRGTLKSYCVLITPEQVNPLSEKRMRVLEKTRDGFVIAEEDLKLRGPGEIFGTRQSGHLRFQLGDPVRDLPILQDAHQAAGKLYEIDANLEKPEHQILRRELILAYGRFQFQRPS